MPRERSETGEFTETVTLNDVLDVVRSTENPIVTTKDVASALDCTTEAARQKLTRLHEKGRVKRRTVGSRAVVWWLAADGDSDSGDESAFARELSRKSIANQYGDDYFGSNPGWADDLPDLGENA